MNNKHLACLVIAMAIFFQLYAIFFVNQKANAMKEQAEEARMAADRAQQIVNTNNIRLTSLKAQTEALRQYLATWTPHMEQSPDEERGQTLIDELIRRGRIQLINSKFDPVQHAGGSYVNKLIRAELLFEDDYHKTLQWLGELERTLPSCRITKCRLNKGTNANDIRLELTVDLPIATATTPKA